MEQAIFLCPYCSVKLSQNKNLRIHVKRFHPLCDQLPPLMRGRKPKNVFRNNDYSCSDCAEIFANAYKLSIHRKNNHSKRCKLTPVINGIFQSVDEFKAWKNAEEDRLICRYHIYRSHRSSKKTIKYYKCHRNGFYQQKGKGKRLLKSQGSCKIGKCLASIVAHHYANGTVSITYYNQHSNHDHDPAHITLRKDEKERLAKLIRSGLSFDDIINQTHYRLGTDDNFHIKFVTKHDLHNIVRSFNIPKSQLNINDIELKTEIIDEFASVNYRSKENSNSNNNFNMRIVKRKRGRKANIADCQKYIDEINKNIQNIDMRSVILIKKLLKECQGIVKASIQNLRSSLPNSNYTFEQKTQQFNQNLINFASTNIQFSYQISDSQPISHFNYLVQQNQQDFSNFSHPSNESKLPLVDNYDIVQITGSDLNNLNKFIPPLLKINTINKKNNKLKKSQKTFTTPINIVPKPTGLVPNLCPVLIAIDNQNNSKPDVLTNNVLNHKSNLVTKCILTKPKTVVKIKHLLTKKLDALSKDNKIHTPINKDPEIALSNVHMLDSSMNNKESNVILPGRNIAHEPLNNQMYLNFFTQPNDMVSIEVTDTDSTLNFE